MANRYFKLFTDTPFCGTDETELFITDGADFKVDYDEIAQELFDSYGYLIDGWGEEDPTEDEIEDSIEDFIAGCFIELEEISKEEFDELAENGFPINEV